MTYHIQSLDVRGNTPGWSSLFHLCCILWSILKQFFEKNVGEAIENDAESKWTRKHKMAATTGIFPFSYKPFFCLSFLLTPHISTMELARYYKMNFWSLHMYHL